MKISWVTGIVASFVLFVLMIFYLVYVINRSNEQLVTDRPYEEGLAYNQVMQRQQRSAIWQKSINLIQTVNDICISFKQAEELKTATGKINLYRPQGDQQDVGISFALDARGQQCIPTHTLAKGRWRVVIRWQMAGNDYEWQKEFYVQ